MTFFLAFSECALLLVQQRCGINLDGGKRSCRGGQDDALELGQILVWINQRTRFPNEYADKVIDNHCSTEPLESSFTSAEEDETGDRSKSAHGTYQESRRLRPAVADGEERVLTKDALQSVYHLPINEAAAQLQVGVTVLKKFCRQHNVGRWPYRKLLSVDKLVRSVEEQSEQNPAGANYIIRELGLLKQEIYNDPEVQLDGKIKKLRQSNFKMQYKQRVYAGKHAMSPGVLQKLGKGCKQDT